MNYESSFRLFTFFAFILTISSAAPRKGKLVHFYPISQEQYDSILRLTNGRPVITEGRLVKSGFRAIRNSIATDLSDGWRQMLNVTNFLPNNIKSNNVPEKGYPLCVIKPGDDSNMKKDYEDHDRNPEIDPSLGQGRQANGHIENDMNNARSSVSCVVVIRRKYKNRKFKQKGNGKEKEKEKEMEMEMQHEQYEDKSKYEKVKKSKINMNSENLSVSRQVLPYYYPTFASPPYGIYPSYPFFGYPGMTDMQRQFPGYNIAPMPGVITRSKPKSSKSKTTTRRKNTNGDKIESPSEVGTARYSSCNDHDYHNSNYGSHYDSNYGHNYDNNYGYYGDSSEYYNSGEYWHGDY